MNRVLMDILTELKKIRRLLERMSKMDQCGAVENKNLYYQVKKFLEEKRKGDCDEGL